MKNTIMKGLIIVPTVVVSTIVTIGVMKSISRRIDKKNSKKKRFFK